MFADIQPMKCFSFWIWLITHSESHDKYQQHQQNQCSHYFGWLQNIPSAVFRGTVVDGCYQGKVRECLHVIWLNWPFNPSLVTRRCLVGDPSGKSYGDVAFLEQHNLQSNILSDKFKMKFWHEHTLIQTQYVYCVTLCLLSRCTSGLSSTGWADGWTSSDFELMCGDGRRAPLSEWESCNLGVIPPNTIMTRPVLTARVYDFLMKSQVSICQVKPVLFA